MFSAARIADKDQVNRFHGVHQSHSQSIARSFWPSVRNTAKKLAF